MSDDRRIRTMRRFRALPIILLCATVADAAVLPLKPGTYVLVNTPCRNPALAAIFTYDGQRFSYPHASACRSITLSHTRLKYRLQETCNALGDGTAAAPSTTVSTYKIVSATQVSVSERDGGSALAYRLCPTR